MSLLSTLLAKAAAAVKSVFVPAAKSAGQTLLDSYKPQAKQLVDQVADKIAAHIDAKVTPESFSKLLHDGLAALKLPAVVQVILELAVASANVDPTQIAAQGKSAVYAEAIRIKGKIDGARL